MPLPRLLYSALTAWLLCLGPACAQALPVTVVTEELPPYNMLENGRATGMCTEIVQATLKEAGLSGEVQVVPWARAYDMALHVDNVLIYSMSRTAEREHLFQWIGPLVSVRWYLYALASHPLNLASLEQAKAYQVATVNQDSGEQFLQANGFAIGRNLQSSSRYALDYEKLKNGHVDLWISDELNANYVVRQAGDDPARVLMPALALTQLGQDTFSMAMSHGSDPQTVRKLREALARLHQNGTFAAILKKWM